MNAITRTPGGTPLTPEQAQQLTAEIRSGAQALYIRLARAYEGAAHTALGYASWSAYCAAELDINKNKAYRILAAGRIIELLEYSTEPDQLGHSDALPERQFENSNSVPLNESAAIALSPLADNPNELRAAHKEAVDTAPRDDAGNPRLTASHVRETVQKRTLPTPPTSGALSPGNATIERVGLNDAVDALARAVDDNPATAADALGELRKVAAAGLYGPQTRDASEAFRDLVDIVGKLLARVS